MKTPTSERRTPGVSEKQARRTKSKEAERTTGSGARKPSFNGRLREKEQLAFQAAVLANMSDAVLATDPQYRITYWNARAERLYGYRAEEVLGRLARAVVHSEATPEQRSACESELEATGRLELEWVQHDDHGNPLLIHSICSTLTAPDGRLLGYVWVNRRVTMPRRDVQQLRQQAELLDLTQDAVLVRDLDSRITFWNRSAESLYGWTKAEAVGQPVQSLLHTRFAQPLAEIEVQVTQKGRWEGELVHTTRQGRPIQVASRWSLQRDVQGRPVAILQINTDITERKRGEAEIHRLNAELEQRVSERTAELELANQKLKQEIAERQRIEDELREAERQASDLIEYAPTAITEFDPSGPRFTRVNDAMCQMCGYTREELLAMNPFILLDEESRRRAQDRMARTRAGQVIDEPVEYRVITKDARKVYTLVNTRLMHKEGGRIRALMIAHDITERKHRELNAAFLDDIGQDLLLLPSPDQMMQTLGDKIARHFEAKRLIFAEVDPARDEMTVLYDSRLPASASVSGPRRLSEYTREEWEREQKAGQVLVVDDLMTDLRFADRALTFNDGGVRAQIIAPFVMDGHLRFIGVLQHAEPHHWRADEIDLARELAARLYPALQRVRTESALRESEERLRERTAELERSNRFVVETLESIQDGFFALDRNWRFTYINQRAANNVGSKPGELVGQNLWDAFPGIRGTAHETNYRQVMEGGAPVHFDLKGVLTDSSYDIRVYPSAEGISVFWVDISERKRMEDALAQSEARFKSLYQSLPYLAMVFQRRGDEFVLTDYNQAAIPFTRGGIAALVGRTARELYAERLETRVYLERAYAEQTVLRREGPYRLITTGEEKYLIQTFAYVPPHQVLLHVEDITDRKRAEDTLRESEERFRTVLENSHDAAYRRNLQTDRNDYLSPVIERITGFSPAELRELSLEEALERFHPDDRARIRQVTEQTLTGELSTAAVEYRYLCKDGQYRWLSDHVSVVRDASGRPKYRVGIIRDETEHRQSDERLAAVNRELQRHSAELAAANKELESFSYSVSHDLRTPLATVDGLSRLLQQEYGASLPEQAQRYLELVRTGTQQMNTLITSLLGLARLSRQPLQKQPANMAGLVGEALATLTEEAARPGLTIEVQELPDVDADPVLLKQVWVNLLANAFKFTRKRERAQIEVGSGRQAVGGGPEPRAPDLPTGHSPLTTVYYVRDNGVGFDMEQVDRLFGVFQRLHDEEEYEGTGVGLATVARIIHRHGGRVWAEGKVGEGATFYFTLA